MSSEVPEGRQAAYGLRDRFVGTSRCTPFAVIRLGLDMAHADEGGDGQQCG
ncbi:hypothetical protein [Streptosporangium longisporum]|uniref:hypothetical protein n=1 Tax=Streptosporangium longisporum TaxID=46187 RepID=UPI0031EC5846